MRRLVAVLALLLTCGFASAQTYTQMQWGMNRGATPFAFGANINGTWRDLGTVTAGGVWSIPSSNISFTPTGAGAVTTTVQNKLRQTVSVIDFGADPTGVADSAPAFRNAIKSDRDIIIPPGTYTLRTTQSISNYCSLNLVCAVNDPAVLVENQSNFRVSGYGATINVASNIAYSAAFLFLKTNNYVVEGFELNGSRSGMLPTQQNAGFALMSNVDWTIQNINFASGFDDLGSPFVGDWLVNGHIYNNRLTNAGQCADFGYTWNLNIVGNYSSGAASSNTQPGQKCWSFINDPLNINTNNTGYAITQNEDINLVNNYVTRFEVGSLISAGKRFSLSNNVWDANPGKAPGSKGVGVLIYYFPSGAFPSVGFPPQDITISGDKFINNGSTVAGAGVLIEPSAITNSDKIKNITIVNSLFDNNSNTAILTTTTAHASNFYTAGNIYAGAAQTTNIDSNTWALNADYFTGDNGGKYITNSNPVFQNVTSPGDGGIEVDNFSASNKWKWNAANATGNFYIFDKTNTKFPFAVHPNIDTTLTLASTGANVSNNVTIGVGGSTNGTLTLASSGGASGAVTLSPASATAAFTATLPANTGTVAELNLAQTFTATQTFPIANFTNTNAGSDTLIQQTNQPGTSVWQQNVSNSNGSWYVYDSTSGKIPLDVNFNSSTTLTVATNGVNSSTRYTVTANLPTISACGTTPPAATAGSSNNAGQFTLGTGTPTACTVTFNSAYANYAYCTVTPASNYTGTYYISAQTKTEFTVTLGTGTSSAVFNYTCFGN